MPLAARSALACSLFVGLSSLGCGHAQRPPAMPAAAQDNVPSNDAVQVDLHARDDEKWTLRRADDTYVCTLPCSYWVRPDSGLTLRLEDTARTGVPGVESDSTSFAVPAHLPANPGEKLTLTVDRTHGLGTIGKIIAAPLAVTFGFMGIAFTALSAASLATGSENTTATASGCTSVAAPNGGPGASGCETKTNHGVAADVGGLAVGVGALTLSVLCTIWFFHDREGGLRYEEPSARQSAFRLRLRPGAVGLETEGARAWVSPAGIAGTF